jgi:hypothetical protein
MLPKKIIIVFAFTRSGKDCFVNTIANKNIAKEGSSSDFKATTKIPESYKINFLGEEVLIINTPGFGDTDLSFSDE